MPVGVPGAQHDVDQGALDEELEERLDHRLEHVHLTNVPPVARPPVPLDEAEAHEEGEDGGVLVVDAQQAHPQGQPAHQGPAPPLWGSRSGAEEPPREKAVRASRQLRTTRGAIVSQPK